MLAGMALPENGGVPGPASAAPTRAPSPAPARGGAAPPAAPLPATPDPSHPRFVADLDVLIRARYPLIYLVTWEEQRLDAILDETARRHGKALLGWSVTKGLRRLGGARTPAPEGARDPVEALAAVEKLSEPALVVLKDFHPFLNDPTVVRARRELAPAL